MLIEVFSTVNLDIAGELDIVAISDSIDFSEMMQI